MSRFFASTDRIVWTSRATPAAITFACWVRSETSAPWSTQFPRAAEFGTGGTIFNFETFNGGTNGSRLRLQRGGTSDCLNVSGGIDTTNWRHLVWVSDGTNEQFWVDGVQQTNNQTGATGNTTTGEIRLGNGNGTSWNRPAEMRIAYPQAYDVALSSGQIASLQDDAWLDIANLIFMAGADCDHDIVADTAGTITGTTLQAADNPDVEEPGGGLTPVSTDRVLLWDVQDAVSTDRQLLWDVQELGLTSVNTDRQMLWNVAAVVPVSRILLWDVAINTQTVGPAGTVSAGSWTPVGAATLHEALDETTPDDDDYIRSPLADAPINLLVELVDGTTVVASQTHNDIQEGVVDGSLALSEGEAGNITDYTDLRVRFTVDGNAAELALDDMADPSRHNDHVLAYRYERITAS